VKLTRLKTALIAVSVCTMALFVGAGAAFANSGPRCGTGTSSGNVNTCFTIFGNDNTRFVVQMHATGTVINATRKLQECIHGPDQRLGQGLCSGEVTKSPGETVTRNWNPNSTVTAGTYCARTWRINSDGSKVLIGNECLDVHS
jgi:hypothetical protein